MRLASLFSDCAVLQRGIPVPVWGWTKPMAFVEASLGSVKVCGKAADDGKFMLRFPPMDAGGPYELSVSIPEDPAERACAKDVWVGEVWLASGQSNMEMTVDAVGFEDEAKALAKVKNLRMITIPRRAKLGRQSDVEGAAWRTASADTVGAFSAVASHFAAVIAKETGLKIGILHSSWGGTVAEAWTSRETLMRNPQQAPKVLRYEEEVFHPDYWKRKGRFKTRKSSLPLDPGISAEAKRWASPSFDDSAWNSMKLPGAWTRQGVKTNGVLWFRKEIEIPASWAGKELKLELGAIDKHDISFFNGEEVGRTGSELDQSVWNQPRVYTVPGRLVKAGRNVVAVRAYSFLYDGGLIGPENRMTLSPIGGKRNERIALSGSWNFSIERDFGVVQPPMNEAFQGPDNPNSPYMLFDNMIAPLLPYAIRGAIWYQGESNANSGKAYYPEYARLLPEMIRDWRAAWGQGDFHFYIVQLANYAASADAVWPFIREVQLKTALNEPNCGLAVAVDVGETADIHPKNKKELGRRLALSALAEIYGKHVAKSGPLFESVSIEGSTLRLRFKHLCGGLVAKGAKDGRTLKGFQIASATREFLPAKAEIDGETVVVSNSKILDPVAVRYLWENDPPAVSLYNEAGLPASPFRSDSW